MEKYLYMFGHIAQIFHYPSTCIVFYQVINFIKINHILDLESWQIQNNNNTISS